MHFSCGLSILLFRGPTWVVFVRTNVQHVFLSVGHLDVYEGFVTILPLQNNPNPETRNHTSKTLTKL